MAHSSAPSTRSTPRASTLARVVGILAAGAAGVQVQQQERMQARSLRRTALGGRSSPGEGRCGAEAAEAALKPPMGWRSWNAFMSNISQDIMLQQVRAIAAPRAAGRSLLEAGYTEVGLDDGWQLCEERERLRGMDVGLFHDSAGHPRVRLDLFPDMASMTQEAHARGVKMGMYLNTCICDEQPRVAKGGHPEQDARAVVALGFDSVKIDGCGPARDMCTWAAAFKKAADEAGTTPPILENCGNNGGSGNENLNGWTLPETSQAEQCPFHTFRVSYDIAPDYYSAMWNLQYMVPFLDKERPLSRPGCWAYPDMLQVGRLKTEGEDRAHFAAWCITSSPLILGFDLRDARTMEKVYPIISNRLAIEVNQAWHGHPGRLVHSSKETLNVSAPHGADLYGSDDWEAPETQIWAKSLGEARVATVLLNNALEERRVCFDLESLGLDGSVQAAVTNVWTQAAAAAVGGNAAEPCFDVPSHDAAFLVLDQTQGSGASA